MVQTCLDETLVSIATVAMVTNPLLYHILTSVADSVDATPTTGMVAPLGGLLWRSHDH